MMTADTDPGIVPVLTDGDELFADLHLSDLSLTRASVFADPGPGAAWLTRPARQMNEEKWELAELEITPDSLHQN